MVVDEIKERSPYLKLHVSIIHDFLWEEIKDYQKNVKQTLLLYSDKNFDLEAFQVSEYSEEWDFGISVLEKAKELFGEENVKKM